MDSLWALNVLFSRIFRFPPSPQSIVFFLHRPTSASTFIPVLSFNNVAASSDTASCAAPVSLSIWVLPPHSPPTPLTAALLSLSVLVGGGGKTQIDRLTGVAQDAVSEEAATLLKDRTGIKVEAEVGRCRKKTMAWTHCGH